MNTAQRWRAIVLAVVFPLSTSWLYGQAQHVSYEQTVNRVGSTVLLSSSANPAKLGSSIAFAARVVGTPAGMPFGIVSFTATTDQSTVKSQNIDLDGSGVAVWNVALASGEYMITAAYGGDLNYRASTSGPLVQSVTGVPDFTLSVVSNSGTIQQGQSLQSVVTVTATNGFDGTVTLRCLNLPDKMRCDWSPAVLTATAFGAKSTLTLTTVATTVETAGIMGIFLGWFWLPVRRRRKRLPYLPPFAFATFALLCAALLACGGGVRYVQTDGTQKGNYDISITASSGTLTHSQHVMVRVQ